MCATPNSGENDKSSDDFTWWKKWTQWDLRFCKNDESKISNNNEKGGQQDQKSRRKVLQIASKVSNDRFVWKNIPTLGQIISRTKCDQVWHKNGTQWD